MARDRDRVLTIVASIAHAEVGKNGTPLTRSSMLDSKVREWFDLAEAMVDEADRRYPSTQPPAGR